MAELSAARAWVAIGATPHSAELLTWEVPPGGPGPLPAGPSLPSVPEKVAGQWFLQGQGRVALGARPVGNSGDLHHNEEKNPAKPEPGCGSVARCERDGDLGQAKHHQGARR